MMTRADMNTLLCEPVISAHYCLASPQLGASKGAATARLGVVVWAWKQLQEKTDRGGKQHGLYEWR
jgi:hypothetical protein